MNQADRVRLNAIMPQADILSSRPTVAKLGTFGIHDRFHLSTAEKRQLVDEVLEFVASRFAGEPCPSCLTDALMGAVGKKIGDTMADPMLNSGTAQDFVERTRNWANGLAGEHRRALTARDNAAEYEDRTGKFRDGRSTTR